MVWSYSLRGELPPDDEYKLGLKELVLSHNNFSDTTASELVLALRNDLYVRSLDLRNNLVTDRWCLEFVRLMHDNKSLTNVDLRLNPGFTQKMHRELALSLLRNIQELNDKGESNKFVKSEVLTIEIPKKCRFFLFYTIVLKKFSQKIMAIKQRKCSTGRNSSTDLGKAATKDSNF